MVALLMWKHVRTASYARLELLPNSISYTNTMLARELRLSANNDNFKKVLVGIGFVYGSHC